MNTLNTGISGWPNACGCICVLVYVPVRLRVKNAWRKARLRSWGSPLRELHVSCSDIGSAAVSIRLPEMPECSAGVAELLKVRLRKGFESCPSKVGHLPSD